MSNFGKINTRTKIIAITAIFSALYAALRIIPTVPMVGTGASFSLSDMIVPLYGILLGPYVGGASIVIGTFAAFGMGKAPVFLGLDFLPALVNAMALGFLVRRKWWPVVVLNAILLVVFVLNPLTLNFVNTPFGSFPFVWLHVAAFVVLISPLGRKAAQWVDTLKPTLATAGLAILAFAGTMMQHLTGNILFEVVLGQIARTMEIGAYAIRWNAIFYLYPWERLALVLLAVLIGVPAIRVLKKSFFASEKKPIPTQAK